MIKLDSFKAANSAARRLAKESSAVFRVRRLGDGFVVERAGRTSAHVEPDRQQTSEVRSSIVNYHIEHQSWAVAEERASYMPIYEKSHRQKEANSVGALGEVIAEKWMQENGIRFSNETENTTHDYRLSNGRKLEIKTKDRTVSPKDHYECSVPLYNHEHQRPDFYLFLSLQRKKGSGSAVRDFFNAFVLGIATQDLLAERGKTWETGDIDPDNGTQFWTSCRNVKISDLISPKDAVHLLK